MNYEKKHKEEIVRATQLWECGDITRENLEYIFPELKKESENEKVKRILHSISSKMSFHLRDIFTEEEFQCFDTWFNIWLEKQGKNNMGISEATKQELVDNLNKALEKETPESWNKFLDEQGEKKPTWSEDNEEKFRDVIRLIEQGAPVQSMRDHCINWLKTLKEIIQSQWKPSEEQMKQLKSAADIYTDSRLGHSLKSLYQDLKKLRKE